MSHVRLIELFQKYLDDTLAPGELEELFALVRGGYDETGLDPVLLQALEDPATTLPQEREDLATAYTALRARIRERDATYFEGARVGTRLVLLRRVAAAAVLVGVLGGALWWYLGHGRGTQPVTPSVTARFDAAPGKDGAVLTLSDGRKVTLDSGSLATPLQQGTTRLRKTAGALSYAGTGSTGTASILYNTLETPRGRQYRVDLSDGTKVWLNAGSSIRYPVAFSGKNREVAVTGEVYFEVAKRPDQPFIATVDKARVTVLGTRFDIMGYPDEGATRVTLVDGAVRVGVAGREVLLEPGVQAAIGHGQTGILTREVDTDPVTAWTRGQLALDNPDLGVLMRQISRWYDVDVVFEGPVPDVHVGGVITRTASLSTVLEFLGENGVHYTTRGKTILISR